MKNRQIRITIDAKALKRKQRIGVWFTKVEKSSKKKKMNKDEKYFY